MIVSMPIAVLPMARSPMISSRWPRPRANIASITVQPGLHRLGHQVAIDDRRRGTLDRLRRFRGNGSLAVERAAEGIDDPAEQRPADRHPHDVAGAAHRVSHLDGVDVIEKDAADPVAFERLREAELPPAESQQFVEPDVRHPRDEGDAVRDLLDPADLLGPRPKGGGGEPRARLIEPGVRLKVRIARHG